jgi:hypothetical protein
MQYLWYFAVATPLVLIWMFCAAEMTGPVPPLFNSPYDHPVSAQAPAPAHPEGIVAKTSATSATEKG